MSAATADPVASPPTSGTTGFTHRQILTILSGLMLGMFLAALDQNIVSTAIRTIADDLQGLNLQAWATTAYLITATISTPLYGKLSDLYGRKPFFLFAIGIFILGSVLCTVATSMYELAGYRALQGLGAGGLMSLALTIIGDIVPPRERARYQGFFLAVFGTASVIGPVVGGFFAGQTVLLGITGWRWVFLVNVPIGIIALLVVFRVLNLPHTRREHRIDWPGASALTIALVPLLIVAEQGREWGWGSVSALVCYAIGVVGLLGFIVSERHYGDDALLPLRLFQNSVFSLTSIIAVITGVGLFGGIAIVPQYLQIVTGATPTDAGLQLLPLVGGLMVASVVSGQLTSRTGRYKVFPVVGLGLMTVGLVLFHLLLHFDTPYWEIAILMAVFGLGVGNCMQTLVIAVQNAVPARDMGVATASATFFRQMGGTLGVAVFLSILFSTVGDRIGAAFAQVAPTPGFQSAATDPLLRANPANLVALDPAAGAAQVVQDSSVLQRMDPRLAEPFLVGFSNAMDLVFLVAACVVALGFVLIWFMRELPLRTQSGIQARDAEDAAVAAAAEAPVDVPDSSPTAGPMSAPLVGAGTTSPTSALHGRVFDADGVVVGPDDGVVVSVHGLDGAALDRTEVAADGTFDVGAPGAGTYVLIASSERLRPFAELVTLDGRPVRRDLTLTRPTVLHGRILGPGDVPVGRATVTVTDAAGGVRGVGRSSADGTWELPALEPGPYTVTVLGAGRSPVADRIELGAGGLRHDVRVPEARYAVDGVVRTVGGGVVPDSMVVLVDHQGAVVASAVTGPDGRFRLADLPAGRHMLTASGFAPVSREVTVQGPQDVELTVEPPRQGQLDAERTVEVDRDDVAGIVL